MHEHQKLPEVIGDIYDTALEPTLWTNALARIMDFVGSRTSQLTWKDPVSRLGDIRYQVGVDSHFVQIYAETYSKFDPLATLPSIGQVVSVPDQVSYDDYRRKRYYQEWFQPQNRADTAYVVIEKSATNTAFLSFAPGEANAMVDDEMRRRIALVAPHARRALLIGKASDLKKSEVATFGDTLNALSAAMFLVDACGRIVHANAAGQDMLYANDFLRSFGGRLAIREPLIDQTLHEAFAACAHGDAGIGTKAIALPMTAHDGERYLAHVLPLTSGARSAFGTTYTAAAAAVFVRKAELGSPSEIIAQTFKLTPTELRVLHAIVEVGGVPETAAALGVAETTVKTHLYRLFDKTSVSRQADLVKLVAGYFNPLVE